MASLRKDTRTKNWLVSFRWNGTRHTYSCRTTRKPLATRILARVEESLELLQTNRIQVPENVDPGRWIFSGGTLTPSTNGNGPKKSLPFGAICERYLRDQTKKAKTTISSEEIHISHLKKVLGKSTRLRAIEVEDLKRYARTRLRNKHHGRPISGKTVKKELTTFRQVWIWAQRNKLVKDACPLLGPDNRWLVNIPKPAEPIRFQTWAQIERRINRGSVSPQKEKELWASLFLDEEQIQSLLEHVEKNATHAFIYPMFAFAAYTGCRRSELCRSEIDDFDFENDQVMIRERKRRKHLSSTTRFVPLHRTLKTIMRDWFDKHPGGNSTLVLPRQRRGQEPSPTPLSLVPDKATKHFKTVLRESPFEVVRGFHVLRHSFGSNLARTGKVSSDVIGKWMGHSTVEMREFYQHLFPQDGPDKINVLR